MQLQILAPKCYCLLHNRSQQAARTASESYVTLASHDYGHYNTPLGDRLADTPEVDCEHRPKKANALKPVQCELDPTQSQGKRPIWGTRKQ